MTDVLFPDEQQQQQQQQQQRLRETRSSKTKEMIKAIPPSPAPSNAEIPVHGLPMGNMADFLQHHQQAPTAYYPQERSVNMESIHPRSQPGTRYSTPVPPRSLYQPTNQQLVQQYPQYNYPQPPAQYDHSPYTFTDEYGTASSQPYNTPATSPPTPSRNTEVRVTRNGTYPRGGKAPTVSRPAAPATTTPKKKAGKDRAKATKKSPHLSGPMSEITRESLVPVIDIEAYVHRSTEERVREVASGKVPGKVKRPMNAFMLYRKAYQNRAKEWCSQHNHQVVSQVCGDSWPLEPDHVRAQFTEWAKIERDNHQKAHPSYKFTPAKPHKPKAVAGSSKRGRVEEEDDGDDDDDDANDPDWHGSKRTRRTATPFEEEEYHQHGRSLYNGGGYQQHNRSAFHVSNPGKAMPPAYDAHAAAGGHYYQTMQVRDGAVEHIMYKKTPGPAMMQHQHHGGGGGGYDVGGAYGPPAPHMQHHHHPYQHQHQHQHQVVQHPHNATHYAPQAAYSPQRVDPSLSGAAGELLDLADYGPYPHQLDPAQWHDSQQLYLDQTMTTTTATTSSSSFDTAADQPQYGGGGFAGDEFAGPALLEQPEQEKIFNQEPWQVLDSSLLGEGEDWVNSFDLQPATAGHLEGVSEA